jgi:ABC-type Mn2+/Zn2+ transport system permease subunit
MDSFQIALGIAIAEVCAKKLKNKTILYGSICTIPDLDVVVGLF